MCKQKNQLLLKLELDICLPLLNTEEFCFGLTQFCIPDKGKHSWRRFPLTNDYRRWSFIRSFINSFSQWFHSSWCHTGVCNIISPPFFSKNTWIPSRRNSEHFCSLQHLPIQHLYFQHQRGRQTRTPRWAPLVKFVQLSVLNTVLLPEGTRLWAHINSQSPDLTGHAHTGIVHRG